MKKSVFFTMAAVAAGTIMPTLLLSSCGKAEEKAAAEAAAHEAEQAEEAAAEATETTEAPAEAAEGAAE